MKINQVYVYLRVKNAAEAIRYYQKAFEARERLRLVEPSGRVGHAELDLGGVVIMLADEYPELGIKGPESLGGTTAGIHLHVENADALLARAEAAGGTIIRPAQDQFYGERSGTVRDPFGHEWMIGHEIEKVTPEEMQRRYDALMGKSR